MPPRSLAVAMGIGVATSTAVIVVWRLLSLALPDRALLPNLVLAGGLLLAWALAAVCVLALAARHEAREAYHRTQIGAAELADLHERARQADALRAELEGYRRLFRDTPTPVPAPAVRAPEPQPARAPSPHANQIVSLRDPLTGLFHRHYFESCLEREIHRMERRNLPLGVLLMEVDGVDALAGGQEEADAVLQGLADLLKRRIRGGDVASRHSAGEFGLLLPEAPLEGVRTRAEQLRSAVRHLSSGITLSLGVAAFPDNGHSPDRLLRAAREALEQSRADGRDRVTIALPALPDRRLMLPE